MNCTFILSGIVAGTLAMGQPAPRRFVIDSHQDPENLDVVLKRYEAMLNACEVPEASRKNGETLAQILGIEPR